MDVHGLTLTTIANLIRSGQHTSEEITWAYLERIDRHNPTLNAYLKVFEKEALAQAVAMDREVAAGKIRGPLHGVPIAVKDIIDIEGTVTTAGGVLLPDVPAAEDAPVIARLRDAGAIILGKLNLHEYAWGGTTNNPHYGRCFNPWKEGYSPGGSSGGAGAAVSAGLCAAALGTDTLGSVRIPSSYCGCVGIKPTAGRVSNRGVYPLSWSMDNVGPLTRRVQDAAAVLKVMQGYDEQDAYAADQPAGNLDIEDHPDVKGWRIGVIENWSVGRALFKNEKETAGIVDKAVEHLVGLGCERVSLTVPDIESFGQVGLTITLADAAAIHKEHMEHDADSIGTDVRNLLKLGADLTPTDVASAHHARVEWRRRFAEVMMQVDCIVTPTCPAPAHPFQPFAASSVATFTGPYNMLGYPAVSVPCGFTDEGLPVGLMIAAGPFQEREALTLAQAYETSSEWKDRFPEDFV